MIVGALGDIVFEVSEKTVRTLDKFKWSGSARWETHERHLNHALTEYTGMDPDSISFSIYLSAYLGTNPMKDIVRIWDCERLGTPVPLTIGEKAYGKYRWAVKSHETSAESWDGHGNLVSCTVSLKLLEYLRK